MADKFFEKLTNACHNLLLNSNNDIVSYLNERGIIDKTIKLYKIGAFPNDLRVLYEKFDISPVELKEKNIIWNAEQSQFKLYPIVIPIRDVGGKSIAIGCRTILSEEKRKLMGIPKYRNSTYRKTSHLFGLDKAVQEIRNKNKVFVVEGYFDAITAQQKHFYNVVATCGTMFSERQLIILSRYTENICILFDNDNAGRRSANNVMSKFENYDKNIKLECKFTPDGFKDLDEYLRKEGDSNFLK